ncbi:MAG: septal ring lytic transglycosylase RlpA family protein [Pseudobdellovibrionaceae bacterium]
MRFQTLVSLAFCSLMLAGCSEIELGSHLFKTWGEDESRIETAAGTSRTSAGTFKVGKPYTVMGRTYYPQETYDYVETGIASWYGPGFHGGKTASGEQYNQNELTAAHRTLQMPSLVRVTNLSNGRAVVVRVNDRGPFAKGRIIDVSGKAANLLGMVGTGTARVKIELLSAESKALASAARNGQSTKGVELAFNETGRLPSSYGYQAPTGPVMSDVPLTERDITQVAQAGSVQGHVAQGRFYPNPVVEQRPVVRTSLYVQAGAFGVEGNAQRLSQKLSLISPAHIEPVSYAGKTLYKVRVGPLDSVGAADTVLKKVLATGQSDAIIVVQ